MPVLQTEFIQSAIASGEHNQFWTNSKLTQFINCWCFTVYEKTTLWTTIWKRTLRTFYCFIFLLFSSGVFLSLSVSLNARARVCVRACVCVHACVCIYVRVCVCVCVCVVWLCVYVCFWVCFCRCVCWHWENSHPCLW